MENCYKSDREIKKMSKGGKQTKFSIQLLDYLCSYLRSTNAPTELIELSELLKLEKDLN